MKSKTFIIAPMNANGTFEVKAVDLYKAALKASKQLFGYSEIQTLSDDFSSSVRKFRGISKLRNGSRNSSVAFTVQEKK